MNITDLADPDLTRHYLSELGRSVDLDDARALAEDAVGFEPAPAGAHVVLAHVAEHDGDGAGLRRWTASALTVDPSFEPAVDDDELLADLAEAPPTRASAHVRAWHLLRKLDTCTGRTPHTRAQLDLVGLVLGRPEHDVTVEGFVAADTWLFRGLLLFEADHIGRIASTYGPLLPASERALLSSWIGVRHRLVVIERADRRRWTVRDVDTGERFVAACELEPPPLVGWHAFVLLVPVGARWVIVGDPQSFVPELGEILEEQAEPIVRGAMVLQGKLVFDKLARIRFCFPGLAHEDAAVFDEAEQAVLELVRRRRPDDAARADGGNEAVLADLLLEAITAHRIITRRVLTTWEIAEAALDHGLSRDEAMVLAREATYEELWIRGQDLAA